MLLAEPGRTSLDLSFTLAGVPVRVHPLFWLVAALLGFSAGDPIFVVIWVAVVFVSILVHEFGHAFAMRHYGESPRVVLHAMGGLTIAEPTPWGRTWANVAPGVAEVPSGTLESPGLRYLDVLITSLLWVNIGWGLINLLPVYPLDGGNISRQVFLMADPLEGVRKSLWVSVGVGAAAAALGLLILNSVYIALLFGFLAFSSYGMLRGQGIGRLSAD